MATAPIRSMGASRSQKPSRPTVAAISAPMPNGTAASWAMRSRLVLCTESRIGATSRGATVLRSIDLDGDTLVAHPFGGGDRLVDHP